MNAAHVRPDFCNHRDAKILTLKYGRETGNRVVGDSVFTAHGPEAAFESAVPFTRTAPAQRLHGSTGLADNSNVLRLLSLTVAATIGWQASELAPLSPDRFHTDASFSVDTNEMELTTAVATYEPHRTFQGYSWVHVYFYAFPLLQADVNDVMNGHVDRLDLKQLQVAKTARERNSSRAVLHLLIEQGATLSNVSLEVPGVTCTIAENLQLVRAGFQEYRFDGKSVTLRGKGRFECDLRSVGMGKRQLAWDVDVNVPAFEKH